MSAEADRLRQAREAKGYSTAKAAAEAMGVAVPTYIQHENGTRGLPAKRADRYARFFGVRPEWLLYGKANGEPAAPKPQAARTVPLISWVAAGALGDPSTQIPEGTETIEISGLPAGDYFATRVLGDSMDRFSPPGSLILVNRAETELRRGRRYIFSLRGDTTYKRWETDPDRLVPESTNPSHEPIFPKSDRDWSVIGRVRITLFDEL
jgi:SOS-response transcriptional repressor LexA